MEVIILGMHRSGTSLITQILENIGLVTGKPDQLLTAANDNREGFGERKDVIATNSALLRSNDYDWYKIAGLTLPPAFDEPSTSTFNDTANKIITDLESYPDWFIKDPRMCLTLPFWKKFLNDPLYLFVFRNPVEVAMSLETRNCFPLKYGLLLWEKYNLHALSYVKREKVLFIHYNELLNNPLSEITKIKDFLLKYKSLGSVPANNRLTDIINPVNYNEKSPEGYDHLLTQSQRQLYQSLINKESGKLHEFHDDKNLARYEKVFHDSIHYMHLTKLNYSLLSTNETLTTVKQKLQNELDNKEEEILEIRAQLTNLEDKLASVEKVKTANNLTIEQLKSELRVVKNLVSSLRKRLNTETERKEAYYNQLKRAKKQLVEKDKTISEYWNRIQDMRLSNRLKRIIGLKSKTDVPVADIPEENLPFTKGPDDAGGPLFTIQPADQAPTIIKRVGKITRVSNVAFHDELLVFNFLNEIRDRLKVSIVIPVYNNVREVRNCVESIFRYTSCEFELILVNDSSPEPAITEYLDSISNRPEVININNDTNLGFVKSANKGMHRASFDLVLLNSDTEVTLRWIQKLFFAAYCYPDTATVTPFSNASGAFSVPQTGVNKPIPPYLSVEEMARLTENQSIFLPVDIPTGNGFCMFIKKNILETVGYFNEEAFGRGYGEENDFSMRCLTHGFKNVLANNLFIYHRGNTSFGDEKQELMRQNREKLNQLHPEYSGLVREFVANPTINKIRGQIGDALKDTTEIMRATKQNLLIVLHEGGGGVPSTTIDLISEIYNEYNTYVLTSDTRYLYVKGSTTGEVLTIRKIELSTPWIPEIFYDQEYKVHVTNVLLSLNIDLVHIRHLFKHYLDLPEVCVQLGIPYILSLHDFYFLSPSINLLSKEGLYTEGILPVPWFVPSPLMASLPNNKEFLSKWMKEMYAILKRAKALVSTSKSTVDIYREHYDLKGIPVHLIEHGRDFKSNTRSLTDKVQDFKRGDKIRILSIGNLDYHKGSRLIRDIYEYDKEGIIDFHFAGNIDDNLQGIGTYHGNYNREEVIDLINRIDPHIGLIASIVPETYCHTLTEMWWCGVPVIGINLGAVGERINNTKGGWLMTDVPSTLALITSLKEPLNDEYTNKIRNVSGLPFVTIKGMAQQYSDLYDTIYSGTKKEQVGLFAPGEGYNGSTYVRVYLPYTHPSIRHKINVHLLNHLDSQGLSDYVQRYAIKKVIVQRNALTESQFERIREMNLTIFFEIDDDLLAIDSSHPEFPNYENQLFLIKEVAAKADAILTSTHTLESKMKHLNTVVLIQNKLDEKLWLTPLTQMRKEGETSDIIVGYFGSYSHAADLNLLKNPFIEAQKVLATKGVHLKLQVVGVTKEEQEWYELVKIPGSKRHYPQFVSWLRTLQWDIGLAPLEDIPINHSKSHIKYLEYAAMGVAGIYSEVGQYPEQIADGVTGLVVENAEDSWKNALIKLASDSEYRTLIRENSLTDLVNNHLLKDYSNHLTAISR